MWEDNSHAWMVVCKNHMSLERRSGNAVIAVIAVSLVAVAVYFLSH
jgi:hypothetical protein